MKTKSLINVFTVVLFLFDTVFVSKAMAASGEDSYRASKTEDCSKTRGAGYSFKDDSTISDSGTVLEKYYCVKSQSNNTDEKALKSRKCESAKDEFNAAAANYGSACDSLVKGVLADIGEEGEYSSEKSVGTCKNAIDKCSDGKQDSASSIIGFPTNIPIKVGGVDVPFNIDGAIKGEMCPMSADELRDAIRDAEDKVREFERESKSSKEKIERLNEKYIEDDNALKKEAAQKSADFDESKQTVAEKVADIQKQGAVARAKSKTEKREAEAAIEKFNSSKAKAERQTALGITLEKNKQSTECQGEAQTSTDSKFPAGKGAGLSAINNAKKFFRAAYAACMDRKAKALQASIAESVAAIGEISKDIDQKQKETAEQQSRLLDTINALQTDLNNQQSVLTAKEKQLKEDQLRIATQQKQILAAYQKTLAETEKSLKELETQLQATQQQLTGLRAMKGAGTAKKYDSLDKYEEKYNEAKAKKIEFCDENGEASAGAGTVQGGADGAPSR